MACNTPFELGPIRPVAEGESLLIRTTRGCSWRKCAFCTSYRGVDFSIRSVAEIKKDISAAAEYYGGYPFDACFLQDGDSFIMKTKELLEILAFLKERFPGLRRITSYGRASTVARKSPAELRELADAGLNRVYIGMESGSDEILALVNKGITVADLIKSGTEAKAAGIEVSEFIIMGIGGKTRSAQNAEQTAAVLNEIDPAYIRVRTIRVKPGTALDALRLSGSYELQTEEELIREQRMMIERLDGISGYLSNDHSMNLLRELDGRLPPDKPALLEKIDRYLDLPADRKEAFDIGVRIGYFRRPEDTADRIRISSVQKKIREIADAYPLPAAELQNLVRMMTS